MSNLVFPSSLALLLMMGKADGDQQSSNSSRQTSEAHDRISRESQVEQAMQAFEMLLAISKSAAAPNSHWQVREAQWRTAQATWEKTAGSLPPAAKALKICAVPLSQARASVERADDLFAEALKSSDPVRAVSLVNQHNKDQELARRSLTQAENCYDAVRKSYWKAKPMTDGRQ